MRRKFLSAMVCVVLMAACSEPAATEREAPGAPAGGDISFEQGAEQIHVLIDGRPFTTFHYEEKWDKPFLFPLRTASGAIVSRGFPVDPREGEEQDHAWHRGIWYGHGDVNGHDFWRELGRDKTGTIVPLSAPTYAVSGEKAALAAELGLRTAQGETIGTVREEFAFSAAGDLRMIDATIVVRADRGQDLKFGDTEDGGFGMRLADAFRQDRGAILLNSEGQKDTENIWGKQAKWIDYSATIDGKPAGVAMFDHPSNLRHPTGWHARGYSLCAANPFAAGDFTGDKSNDGSYTVKQGDSLTFRYRVVIHQGETPPEQIEQLYGQYAGQ